MSNNFINDEEKYISPQEYTEEQMIGGNGNDVSAQRAALEYYNNLRHMQQNSVLTGDRQRSTQTNRNRNRNNNNMNNAGFVPAYQQSLNPEEQSEQQMLWQSYNNSNSNANQNPSAFSYYSTLPNISSTSSIAPSLSQMNNTGAIYPNNAAVNMNSQNNVFSLSANPVNARLVQQNTQKLLERAWQEGRIEVPTAVFEAWLSVSNQQSKKQLISVLEKGGKVTF